MIGWTNFLSLSRTSTNQTLAEPVSSGAKTHWRKALKAHLCCSQNEGIVSSCDLSFAIANCFRSRHSFWQISPLGFALYTPKPCLELPVLRRRGHILYALLKTVLVISVKSSCHAISINPRDLNASDSIITFSLTMQLSQGVCHHESISFTFNHAFHWRPRCSKGADIQVRHLTWSSNISLKIAAGMVAILCCIHTVWYFGHLALQMWVNKASGRLWLRLPPHTHPTEAIAAWVQYHHRQMVDTK